MTEQIWQIFDTTVHEISNTPLLIYMLGKSKLAISHGNMKEFKTLTMERTKTA